MTTNNISVEQFISEAVRDGVAMAPLVYFEMLEESLKQDVALTEAGSAQDYLQRMINEAETATAE
jgi:hypothetical protein